MINSVLPWLVVTFRLIIVHDNLEEKKKATENEQKDDCDTFYNILKNTKFNYNCTGKYLSEESENQPCSYAN